ncbi:hypothetical protein [Halioxenophilus aromaticivorans]|uniref:Lipoprotein n=1 Tax=Halioxenophilus aromaticivorans TaxID=1306992 RepID=A0AAV3U0Q8_9ALTE
MKTKTIHIGWRLPAALLLLCGIAMGCNASEEKIEQMYFDQFRPNYLAPEMELQSLRVGNERYSTRHYNAFGLDNRALERAAAELSRTSMATTEREMNRYWLYVETHQVRWERGSSIITAYLKSKARAAWDNMMAAREAKRRAAGLPERRGSVDYDMDLTSDSLELFFIYQF